MGQKFSLKLVGCLSSMVTDGLCSQMGKTGEMRLLRPRKLTDSEIIRPLTWFSSSLRLPTVCLFTLSWSVRSAMASSFSLTLHSRAWHWSSQLHMYIHIHTRTLRGRNVNNYGWHWAKMRCWRYTLSVCTYVCIYVCVLNTTWYSVCVCGDYTYMYICTVEPLIKDTSQMRIPLYKDTLKGPKLTKNLHFPSWKENTSLLSLVPMVFSLRKFHCTAFNSYYKTIAKFSATFN